MSADERRAFEELGDLVLGTELRCACGCQSCAHHFAVRTDGAFRVLYLVGITNCERPVQHLIQYGGRDLVGITCAPRGHATWIAQPPNEIVLD